MHWETLCNAQMFHVITYVSYRVKYRISRLFSLLLPFSSLLSFCVLFTLIVSPIHAFTVIVSHLLSLLLLLLLCSFQIANDNVSLSTVRIRIWNSRAFDNVTCLLCSTQRICMCCCWLLVAVSYLFIFFLAIFVFISNSSNRGSK